MTAKQYLSQLKKIDIQIIQLMSEKDFQISQLTMKSIAPKEIQVVSSLPADPMADRIARIVDIEKELDEKIDKLVYLRQAVVQTIQTLEDPLQIEILYKRYVEYKRWEVIERETHYSFQHLQRVHKKALKNLEMRKMR